MSCCNEKVVKIIYATVSQKEFGLAFKLLAEETGQNPILPKYTQEIVPDTYIIYIIINQNLLVTLIFLSINLSPCTKKYTLQLFFTKIKLSRTLMSEHCTMVYGLLKLSVKELSKVAEALSLDKKTLVKYF